MINRTELGKLRDELYEQLPSGEINAFDLIKIIKSHIRKLDDLILSLKTPPTEDKQ